MRTNKGPVVIPAVWTYTGILAWEGDIYDLEAEKKKRGYSIAKITEVVSKMAQSYGLPSGRKYCINLDSWEFFFLEKSPIIPDPWDAV